MNAAALFGVPFPGRCLSPLPETKGPHFQKGDWVCWVDGEEGIVLAATEHAVCICWSESQTTWYGLHSVAVRENIIVLRKEVTE